MNTHEAAAENDAAYLISLTVDVVSAYVSRNTIPVAELAGLVSLPPKDRTGPPGLIGR